MQTAEVLWCPIQKETRFFGIPEIYGKTKMSGNIGDAIKYAKPAIFPKSYSASYSFIFKEKEISRNKSLKLRTNITTSIVLK
jgi:hypothetical protein